MGQRRDRINRLRTSGYDPNAIQSLVNKKLGGEKKSNETIADEVIAGKWGNGSDRNNRLTKAGNDYGAIRAIVNRKLR